LVEVSSGSGDVYCWGLNDSAQLGQGYTNEMRIEDPPPATVTPLRVKAISRVTALFASEHSTCALTVSGRVACWGLYGGAGRLGVGTPEHYIKLPALMKQLCA
jgi:alpha-tubulin suppressor-like RCC1 family protein